ncbi:outer membrane porin GjpA [Mycolicibacterium boenickei]|uniref:Outer membrane porin GjpA n=1 Tax=Mycolicibacterium boenickei TaxID=146017 RepID=A0AAX3A014_9MYCO|nr:outer membrane porin GjpA [Mycolicibacterium boenickei]PEG59077.1 hypothetical protein CQY21_19650 [Mycolicibacterium boenickei]UNC00925.1 outer membrane porin GjpA [Mycolicibacterium boenickei]BBX90737.1 hypothetical protein MBOE_23860 [Mycolicibacterium boenickei]
MHAALRPYATAGIALVGASVIAVTPVIAPPAPPDIQVPRIAAAEVGLTAATDVLSRWVEVFNTASGNATKLADFSFEAPATALQQVIVNQVGYMGDVLNDPANIGSVFERIGANLQKAFSWATMQGLPDDINDPGLVPVLALSNDPVHTLVVALLPSFLPEGTPEFVTPLVHFLASPLSGVLIGFAGPLISPAAAALNSIMAGDLLNLPANVVDGFFNGATLNLDALLPAINGAGVLPEGTTFDKLGIAFGGLLSPGTTANTIPFGTQVGEPGIGGSVFSSLDLAITTNALGFPFTLQAPGVPVGPIGALASLSQIVAGAIGWDGEGNPLTHISFPTLPTGSENTAPVSAPLSAVAEAPDVNATTLALDAPAPAPTEAPITEAAPAEDAAAPAVTATVAAAEDEADRPSVVDATNKFTPRSLVVDKETGSAPRVATAAKSLGGEASRAAKKIGDDVKKALGIKPKKEKKAAAHSVEGDK